MRCILLKLSDQRFSPHLKFSKLHNKLKPHGICIGISKTHSIYQKDQTQFFSFFETFSEPQKRLKLNEARMGLIDKKY